MSKIILHAGLEKTGNTALKSMLEYSYDNLCAKGIYVIIPEHIYGSIKDQVIKAIEKIDMESCKFIIISCEAFGYMGLRDLFEIKSNMKFSEIRILLYIRDYFKWIQSNFLQALEGCYIRIDNKDVSLDDALLTYIEKQTYFYLDSYDRISKVFGAENITVKLYDRKILKGGDICKDFAEFSEIEDAILRYGFEENKSMSPKLARLALEINKFIRKCSLDVKNFVKNEIMIKILSNVLSESTTNNKCQDKNLSILVKKIKNENLLKENINKNDIEKLISIIKNINLKKEKKQLVGKFIEREIAKRFYQDAIGISKKLSPEEKKIFLVEMNTFIFPKISIIIVAFNTEKALHQCIESCLKQSYENIEIIIVDDCSTDNVPLVIKKSMLIDSRIKFIRNKKNLGIVQSRIIGFEISNGEYIWHIDSDDYIDERSCERLVHEIESNNSPDMICFGAYSVKKNKIESHIWSNKYLSEKPIPNLDWVLFKNHTAWSRILKRDIFHRAIQHIERSLYLNNGEDFLVFTIAKYYVKKFINVNEKLYYYVNNEDSVTNNYDEISIAEHFSQRTLAFQTLIDILTKKIGFSIDLNRIFSFYTSIMLTRRDKLIKSNSFINELEKEKLLDIFYKNIDVQMIIEAIIEERKKIAEKKDTLKKERDRIANERDYLIRKKDEIIRDRDRIAEEKYRILKKQKRYIQVEKNSILGFIVMITLKIRNALFRSKHAR
jgi:glycosyltransferase involved in cell wall biosynthesis